MRALDKRACGTAVERADALLPLVEAGAADAHVDEAIACSPPAAVPFVRVVNKIDRAGAVPTGR